MCFMDMGHALIFRVECTHTYTRFGLQSVQCTQPAWYDYTEKCSSIYHTAQHIQHISKIVIKANLGQLVVVMKVSRSTIFNSVGAQYTVQREKP